MSSSSTNAPRPAAVLWDQDGTLIDSEPYWIDAEFALVAEHGGHWSHEQALTLVGNSLPVSAQIIKATGVRLSETEILDYLIDRVIAAIQQKFPWRPGARELLTELNAADIPTALVTASYRRLAQAVADATGGLIDVVVAGDEVRHGKPDPEPYLRAAQLLGVDPADCVAIEDSPGGITSALASGACTLAVPCMVPIPPRPGLRVRDSLTEVDLAALRGWFV